MASGNVVGIIGQIVQPAANFATLDTRAGGSTPAEAVLVYEFDDTTIEYLDFYCRLEGYAGGGLTVSGDWSAADTTVDPDVVLWEAAIRRIQDDADDIDASHSYDYNAATEDAEASASGETSRFSIAFTHGADMDSLADGESFILRLRRNTTTSGNNLGGDAQLWPHTLTIKET